MLSCSATPLLLLVGDGLAEPLRQLDVLAVVDRYDEDRRPIVHVERPVERRPDLARLLYPLCVAAEALGDLHKVGVAELGAEGAAELQLLLPADQPEAVVLPDHD